MGWLNRYWQADEDLVTFMQLVCAAADDEVPGIVTESVVDGAE